MAEHQATIRYAAVPAFPGYTVGTDGSAWVRKGARWMRLKPQPGARGYLRVTLYNSGGPKRFLLHRLILTVFVGPCPDGMECRHAPDPDPANCRLDNLSWGTRKQNVQDVIEAGRYTCGIDQWKAVLSDDLVRTMRQEHAAGASVYAVARKHGVDARTARAAINGRTWKHVC